MTEGKLTAICRDVAAGTPMGDALILHGVDVADIEAFEGGRSKLVVANTEFKARMLRIMVECTDGENVTTVQFNSTKWLLENRCGFGPNTGDFDNDGSLLPQELRVISYDHYGEQDDG